MIVSFVAVPVVMAFVIVLAVFADAGVLLVVAGRAVAEVEVEFLAYCLGAWRCLYVENDWQVVSRW